MAVVAPMPNASVTMAVSENAAFLRSVRMANARSLSMEVPLSWYRRYGWVLDAQLLQIRRVLRRVVVVLPHLVAIARHLLRIQPYGGLIAGRHERLVLDRLRLHVAE